MRTKIHKMVIWRITSRIHALLRCDAIFCFSTLIKIHIDLIFNFAIQLISLYTKNHRIIFRSIILTFAIKRDGKISEKKPYVFAITSHGLIVYSFLNGRLKLNQVIRLKRVRTEACKDQGSCNLLSNYDLFRNQLFFSNFHI